MDIIDEVVAKYGMGHGREEIERRWDQASPIAQERIFNSSAEKSRNGTSCKDVVGKPLTFIAENCHPETLRFIVIRLANM